MVHIDSHYQYDDELPVVHVSYSNTLNDNGYQYDVIKELLNEVMNEGTH